MKQTLLSKNITVLVNSCDSYCDLWPAFFTLLKRYWNTEGVSILLNTETKDYAFEGLDIKCIHYADEPYGSRMIHALRQIKTEYVINMLDDFFLRKHVDNERVNQILDWMDGDKRIAYFSFDPYVTEYDFDCPYEGFSRICPGTKYTLTLQLAIWRTNKFLSYWRRNITPWEWELYTNIKTCWRKKDLFYRSRQPQIFDYGHYCYGDIWGVFRGKWVMEDVAPLFAKEGILVDYEARNNQQRPIKIVSSTKTTEKRISARYLDYQEIFRLLGVEGVLHRVAYSIHGRRMKRHGKVLCEDFYVYTLNNARTEYRHHSTNIF